MVRAFDFTSSDRRKDPSCGKDLGILVSRPWAVGGEDWSYSYRVREPENEPISISTLALRMERQRGAAWASIAPRRDPVATRLARAERQAAMEKDERLRCRAAVVARQIHRIVVIRTHVAECATHTNNSR